jgi:hypothetical protein
MVSTTREIFQNSSQPLFRVTSTPTAYRVLADIKLFRDLIAWLIIGCHQNCSGSFDEPNGCDTAIDSFFQLTSSIIA